MQHITVVTLCQGTKYSPDYVTRLRNSVSRHLTVPHNFVCMTDKPDQLDCETMPVPLGLEGWWGKVALFGNLFQERVLFLDLDTVILGNIDDFACYDGELAVIKPFYRDKGVASGLLNIDPACNRHVWDVFSRDPTAAIEVCKQKANPPWNLGDQRWLELTVQDYDYWQDLLPGQLVSYKVQKKEGLSDDARIVVFHGKPDPHEVEDQWVVDNWV
ncbi:MAG: hypothetical protein MI673_06590, partial [Thiotrichales bacterium]|nr:hypothetical protein [Thiotrichales bacterium]